MARPEPRRRGLAHRSSAARQCCTVGGIALLALPLVAGWGRAASVPVPSLGRSSAVALRVRTVTGESLSLDRLIAKGPVLLDFWATWCHPCLAELPELERLHRKYRDRGVTVVGVSVDGPRNFAKVRPFAARLGLTFPIVLDEDGRIQQLYQVRAMPTTVLIDATGVIASVREGYRPGDTQRLEAELTDLLSPPPVEAPKR